MSAFIEELKSFLTAQIPEYRHRFECFDPRLDPLALYPVACRISNGKKPLLVFAVSSDEDCSKIIQFCTHFDQMEMPFATLSIFKHQEKISRRLLAQLSDVGGKQFSNLKSNKDRIVKYLVDYLAEQG